MGVKERDDGVRVSLRSVGGDLSFGDDFDTDLDDLRDTIEPLLTALYVKIDDELGGP